MTRLVAVSLKAYLSPGRTLDWARELAEGLRSRPAVVDLVVFPDALTAREVAAMLTPYGVRVGLQDVSEFGPGAYTGEIAAAHAAAAGLRYAELGHAERRRHLGETPRGTARKVAAAAAAGLIPLVCVGEQERVGAAAAAEECLRQLAPLAEAAAGVPFVVAYEPVWAIGRREPAPVEHIRTVGTTLTDALAPHPGARVVYGGSAGPGLFGRLGGAVHGLFLGRFAHHVRNLTSTIAEVASASTPRE
ncbi:triose-phosphate isomerase family protein [Microbacterium sp. 18062]|uniref:triose-phosphate isomerase n=1 Tax=Microbacterium sp. 18062 TaxID=2681410 RepID=UPI00135743EE|nr:triose-phosphate isomerase family protein [Microbacterium sp. 18062]